MPSGIPWLDDAADASPGSGGAPLSRREVRQSADRGSAARTATPGRRRARRGRPSIGASCGVVLIGVALGMGAGIWNSVYGTDIAAREVIEQDVTRFRDQLPPLVREQGELHRDFQTDPPPESDLSASPWGMLIVPSWRGGEGAYGERLDDAIPVKQGVASQVLDGGAAGHFIETAGPGQVGNFGLAAHRRSHGSNFYRLPELVPGDRVIVETAVAWYVYEVIEAQIVPPDQAGVLAPVPDHPDQQPTDRLITLITCHSVTAGAWGNDHRWVTHGRLIGWLEHDAGMPAELLTGS